MESDKSEACKSERRRQGRSRAVLDACPRPAGLRSRAIDRREFQPPALQFLPQPLRLLFRRVAQQAVFAMGLSKTGFLGVSLLGIALMAQVWPPRESTGIILPMLLCGDVFAVTFFARHSVWSEVVRVLPPAIAGVIIGYFWFRVLPAAIFGPLIGWIILALLILQIWYRSFSNSTSRENPADPEAVTGNSFLALPGAVRRTVTYCLGALAGITTMLANASGPVMTVYLLAAGLAKYEFVGTSAWIFFLLNLCKLPLSYSLGVINLHSLQFNLLMLPAIALGAVAGKTLLKLIPQLWFDRLLMLSALVAAIKLLWR